MALHTLPVERSNPITNENFHRHGVESMKQRNFQTLMMSFVALFAFMSIQSSELQAQTVTTFEVKVALQGYWNGVSHRKSAAAIELRTGVDLTTSLLSRITTGIIDENGDVTVSFEDLPSGNYWLVVRHGSHMPVATLTRQSVTEGQTHSYDFTNANDKAFPGFDPFSPVLVEFGNTGVFQVRTGDLDGDQTCSANDFIQYFLPNFGATSSGQVPDID